MAGGHKYGARRTTCGAGHNHPSKGEAGRCDTLHTMQRAGYISGLEQQPKFPVKINGKKICTYIADFAYIGEDGALVIEDFKGAITAIYRLKKKIVEAYYPNVKIVEVRA